MIWRKYTFFKPPRIGWNILFDDRRVDLRGTVKASNMS